jgi:cytoskeletal protein RodZ
MKSKSKTKKKVILPVLIILLLSLGAALWYVNRSRDKSKIEVSEATKKQTEQNDAQQAKSLDNKNSNQSSSGTSTSTSAKPSLDITTAEQVDDRLIVSALVSNTNSGTCNLTLKNGSSVISKSAPVGQQVSYYVCQGFIINSSEINPKGDWDLTIKLDSPNGSFETSSRKVSIK